MEISNKDKNDSMLLINFSDKYARANYLNVLLSNSVVRVGEMRLHPLPTINKIYNQRRRKPSVQEISGNQKYLHN